MKQLVTFLFIALVHFHISAQRPNIILIMTDDQGWYDVGFNGNTDIKTPNIDHLASQGIVFDRFYAASAVCSPTRASVLTGRNPLRTNVPYANSGHLPQKEITLTEILKNEGFSTAHFGKWHLGTLTKKTLDANRGGRKEFEHEYSLPTEHGYDEFFCTESKVPTYDPMIKPSKFDEGESLRYGWRTIENPSNQSAYGTKYWTAPEEMVTNNLQGDNSKIIMDRVIPFIEKAQAEDKLFFTTIWFHTPHLPVVTNQHYRDLYPEFDLEKQLYYGSISAMDEQIGRLWDTLKAMKIENNTMIWFCSDNGPEKDTPGSAGKYRSGKRYVYEGGIRVPAFALWKSKIQGGQRSTTPAVTSDYLPTILDALDINYPYNRPLDGTSLMPVLYSNDLPRNKPLGFLVENQYAWMNDQYKLLSLNKGKSYELYDLLNDPYEKENLSLRESELQNEMKNELSTWMESVERSKKGMDYD